jgi:hypothetical protein
LPAKRNSTQPIRARSDNEDKKENHTMSTIPPVRTDTVIVQSAPRPTPTPSRVSFKQVMAAGASGLARGAELAMHALPGSPMTAAAVRGGGGGATNTTGGLGVGVNTRVAEGPGGVGVGGVSVGGVGGGGVAVGVGGTGVGVGTGAAGENTGGIEGSLAQAQEMNLYYLQIQEQVNAQNRVFSTLSNVLKAEHDTVKTAIGNIR